MNRKLVLTAAATVALLGSAVRAFYNPAPSGSAALASALGSYEDTQGYRKAFLVPSILDETNLFTAPRATVQYYAQQRKVFVSWSQRLGNTAVSDQVWVDHEFATRFHPTAVEEISPTEILVAGVTTDDARIIIEKWTFDYPSLIQGGTFGGPQFLELDGGGRSSVDLLYNEPRGIDGRISMLCENLGDVGGSAFVLMDGQDELFAFHFSTGAMSLVASSVATAGPLGLIPELGFEWTLLQPIDHETDGYLYPFYEDPQLPSASLAFEGDIETRWLMFYDFDRDGVLDSGVPMNAMQASLYHL